MNRILDISTNVNFDDSVIDFKWHSHNHYTSNSFKNSDEIRIPVHQQDVYTLPSKSFLIIEGKITKPSDGSNDTATSLVNNAAAFLFDEIQYELCVTEIDRVKNVGITTSIKNILTARPGDANWMGNAGCNLPNLEVLTDKTNFSFCVPLKLLLGFAEDYNNILLNVKQELVLLRSSTDNNAIMQTSTAAVGYKLDLNKIVWKIPYVKVDDDVNLSLLRLTEKDQPISVPFRRWQIHEYLSLPSSKSQTWTVKTSSMMEKPRYVIIGFQTDRKDSELQNATNLDFCNLENVKLYLNSKYFPYDNLNGSKSLLYEPYSNFQSSYHVGGDNQPCLSKSIYLSKIPLFVIDCSKQSETLKTGSLKLVRVELQTTTDIPANTTAYCLIIHDRLIQYTPLSGIVKKIM